MRPVPKQHRHSYAELLTWAGNIRYELPEFERNSKRGISNGVYYLKISAVFNLRGEYGR